MTFDKTMEIGRAVENGKTIQIKSIDGDWVDWLNPRFSTGWTNWSDDNIRIKPELKMRLVRAGELPMPCVIRLDPESSCYRAVLQISVSNDMIWYADGIKVIAESIESLRLKKAQYRGGEKHDWHNFEVEDK